MDSKQVKANPEGSDRDKLDDRIEDLPPKTLAVKRDDAVKGGVGNKLLDRFP